MKFNWKSFGMAVGGLAIVLSSTMTTAPAAAAPSHTVAPGNGTYDAQPPSQAGYVTYHTGDPNNPGWGTLLNEPLAAWNTIVYSTNPANSVSFEFPGSNTNNTTIGYMYTMASNRGNFDVYINTHKVGSYSAYARETRRQVIKTWTLPPNNSTYNIVIQPTGGGIIDFDAFIVNQDHLSSTVSTGTEYDDTNSFVRTIGTWSRDSTYAVGAFNNTQTLSNIPGNVVRLTFSGSKIEFKFSKAYNRGIVAITLDGEHFADESKEYFSEYGSGTTLRQQKYTIDNIPEGIHTIHLTVTGTPGCSDQAICGAYVDVDSFTIYP